MIIHQPSIENENLITGLSPEECAKRYSNKAIRSTFLEMRLSAFRPLILAFALFNVILAPALYGEQIKILLYIAPAEFILLLRYFFTVREKSKILSQRERRRGFSMPKLALCFSFSSLSFSKSRGKHARGTRVKGRHRRK